MKIINVFIQTKKVKSFNQISNTKNTYKKVCLSDFLCFHHKTWFFDTVRTWFFDMVDRQGKTNRKCSVRVTKSRELLSGVIPLKMSVVSRWTPQTIDD